MSQSSCTMVTPAGPTPYIELHRMPDYFDQSIFPTWTGVVHKEIAVVAVRVPRTES